MICNPKIYSFSLFEAGYASIHSLIRDLFDSPNNVCPSLSQGDLLYVLSKIPPARPLHHSSREAVSVNKNTKKVKLETHVAFCNRHRENIIPEKIYPEKALEKFRLLSGIEKDQANCWFLGPHSEKNLTFIMHFVLRGYLIFWITTNSIKH